MSLDALPNTLDSDSRPLDLHVVVLINYLRRHHVLAYREVAKHVRKLTILASTAMEPDRQFDAEWEDLDVRVQKNWMLTRKWKHSAGFDEPNFIHIPVDTNSQLRKLQPDVVLSYELGMRTLFSSIFRRLNRKTKLVMVGNMSDHIERERGLQRRLIRGLIRRNVDAATFNGPSCKRYLERLGFSEDNLYHVPYCFDRGKSNSGDKAFSQDGVRRLLFCGMLSTRKGVLPFTKCLIEWCNRNESTQVQFELAGTGPLEGELKALKCPGNLELNFLGNCSADQLQLAYAQNDICIFPTLADEWGLVPVEAMASGVPVLGSSHAQSIESLIVPGENGWAFSPNSDAETLAGIDSALNCSPQTLSEMSLAARKSVAHITPQYTSDKIVNMISRITGATNESTDSNRLINSERATASTLPT